MVVVVIVIVVVAVVIVIVVVVVVAVIVAQDMNEMKKKLEQLQKSQDMMEEEAGNIRDIVHRAVQKLSLHSRKGSSNASLHSWTAGGGAGDTGDVSMLHDLGMITETMQQLENDRRVSVIGGQDVY